MVGNAVAINNKNIAAKLISNRRSVVFLYAVPIFWWSRHFESGVHYPLLQSVEQVVMLLVIHELLFAHKWSQSWETERRKRPLDSQVNIDSGCHSIDPFVSSIDKQSYFLHVRAFCLHSFLGSLQDPDFNISFRRFSSRQKGADEKSVVFKSECWAERGKRQKEVAVIGRKLESRREKNHRKEKRKMVISLDLILEKLLPKKKKETERTTGEGCVSCRNKLCPSLASPRTVCERRPFNEILSSG